MSAQIVEKADFAILVRILNINHSYNALFVPQISVIWHKFLSFNFRSYPFNGSQAQISFKRRNNT